MLAFFPVLGWLAAGTAVVMLVMLQALGALPLRQRATLVACLLLAGYCQFFAESPLVAAGGLALQTMLAIYLIVRWRLAT
jgi:hypothetical protein